MNRRTPITRSLLAAAWLMSAAAPVLHAQFQVPEVEELKNQPITDAYFHLPVDEGLGRQIDQLIASLNDPDYSTREAAVESLTRIGATAFAKLRQAYHGTDDLELRLKIEEVVWASYLSQTVFRKTGFLGMQQDTRGSPPSHQDDPRIPEGTYGIRIGMIVKNTGAERAGLRAGDIILEVNGMPHEGMGNELFLNFSALIRRTGPGEQLHLTILRPEEGVFDVTATLGPVPRDRYRTVSGMAQIIPVVNERFDIWWKRFFVGDETEPVNVP